MVSLSPKWDAPHKERKVVSVKGNEGGGKKLNGFQLIFNQEIIRPSPNQLGGRDRAEKTAKRKD